ncbi:twin-arginine translocation signal domain-containing protein [Halobaculum sp. WSA2]|uniref:Twin-arginine translocation signal domain-containing protein n=1 Tax=Halobaculum saliterrae TaxID=2073113 RepID=A0A6B0SVE6_9EURY|nr:ABC transporter substrate-binding protein [Halobaculum saliterrae]MXR41586.1 twin-arginine translocation signal domain-containing protein [Halobaculum saliterrae]
MSDQDTSRRRFLQAAGSATAAVALAGCSGNGGDPTEGTLTTSAGGDETQTTTSPEETTERPEPDTRDGFLQRANRHTHEQAPWVFLHRQYSVYGQSSDIEWQPRTDERVAAYAIEPATDAGDDVVMTQSQMDSGLDPQDHRETPTDNIVLQAYEGLLERDREGAIVETLATDYERLDETTVQFTVRDNVSFHSGDSLTPEDVAFSINRIVDSDVGIESPQVDQLIGVEGAEVASSDDRTVNVNLSGLNPIVFASFATYCDVMNKSWVESNDQAYINQNMDGTGPFELSNYEQGVAVEFQRNDDYWDDPAAISTFTINSASESSTRVNRLLSDETDIAVNVPPQEVSRVENSDDASISAVPSTRVIFNAMRYDVEPFDSPAFRRAVNHAVDLDSIIENVLQTFGSPTAQPTLEGFFGHNEDLDPYPRDLERAEELVEESGYAGAEIELVTPIGRYLKDVEIAQAVASQVDELSNVSATARQVEFSTLVSQVTTGNIEDKPDWYLLGWGNATFDAIQTIQPLLASDGALTSYKNDELDRLLDEAQSLPSESN